MKSINYGIEYAHIYTDKTFNDEQLIGILHLKRIEKKLNGNGYLTSRIVLIDDYSSTIPFEKFPIDRYIKSLKIHKALPNVIMRESELTSYCEQVLNLLTDHKLKKRITRYIDSRHKYPCSLFIAAWYLLRLKAFGVVPIKTIWGNPMNLFSEHIVTILPDSFRTPELEASNIIHNTPFRDLEKRIERKFFYYLQPQCSDWNDFDTFEYLNRNYGRELLIEDKKIIELSLEALSKYKIPLRGFLKVADIGTGPNIYPPMLLSPYVSDRGIIELIDIAVPNIMYLNKILSNSSEVLSSWYKFEKLMFTVGGKIYSEALQRITRLARVKRQSIFDLGTCQYDAVTCFFVTEGINRTLKKFYDSTQSLINAVKEGGIIITTHMVQSKGYFAGERTSFPSTYITVTDIERAFSVLKHKTVKLIKMDNNPSLRLGYHGMALMVGKK